MMNNLQSSAFVAKTTQLLSSVAHLRLLLVMLLTLTASTAWGDTETLAKWTFTSSSYPSNNTNFDATDGTCKTGSAFYLNGSGSTWNTSSGKGYAFTAVNDITITLKLSKAIPTATKITFSADMFYNKDSNAPMTGFSMSVSENGSTFTTTGLDVTSISLSTTSANKKIVYTTQTALAKDATIQLKYTQTGKKGAGQGYFNNIQVVAEITNAPSYTVTATSNNNTYGTVSVSGTTITASPKTGYTYANPAYTVTSGTATVTQNGNTFTVTPSSNCSIRINFAEKVKNTYIDNVQGNSEQALYDSHKTPTLTDKTPATTGTCEQQHWHFMGWVTEANKENPTDANIVKANTSVTANGTTYYAVWAIGGTTNTSKQYSFDITKSNFNTTSYAANNNEKTSTAKASDGSTMSVKWTSNQVMLQSDVMQWQKNTGYIYNSTDLGTINSVTVTSSAGSFTTYYGTSKQPTSNTTVGNGYFQINVGNATGKTSKVTVTFTQGTSTTTYSDYITSCITETTVSLIPNGGEIDGSTNNKVIQTENGTLKLPEPTRDCYTFTNWNTEEDGTGESFAADEIADWNSENTTLYAQWTQNTYTITWKNGDAVLETDNNVPCGTTPTYDSATPTKPSTAQYTYAFSGWSPEIYAADKDQVYTAQFSETLRQYTVTFNANGHGTAPDAQIVDYNKKATEPSALTATGYTFGGWYKESGCTNAWNFATDVVTGNVTLYAKWTEKPLTRYRTDCDACIPLDGYAEINGTYHFFPGETITMTVTPPADAVTYTYQWQKFVVDKWEDINGETNVTYTKDEATIEDVGHYRCVVSADGYCDAIAEYNVKCLQLNVYFDDHSPAFTTPLEKVDATTAAISVDLQNANYKYYFEITDGCENFYGFNGDIHSGWYENVELNAMNSSTHCGLQTTKFGTYVFTVDHSYLTDDSKSYPVVTVTYPASLQEANKVIYLDNHVLDWTNSDNAEGKNKIYYRIGHENHNSKTAMTLVPGTANLYKVTTSEYNNFEVWHIANNGCWSEDNSIYKTKTGDEWAATQATAFETVPVTLPIITVTPTTPRSVGSEDRNNNCEFYNYDITEGMKTWNAEVIEPTNGTITVEYTHHDGTVVNNFTSGDRDLAHTCLLTITATPEAGYSGALTVNGEPFTSGHVHTLAEDAVIEVVWTEKADPHFTWSADSYTAALEADNNYPTLNNPNSLSVTYTSSDENVAKIDENGNIVLGSEGRTIITAFGAESATHKSATDFYELIVVAANCKWVETDIANINSGDEVVITMTKGNYVWTILNEKNTSTAPNATDVSAKVEGKYLTQVNDKYKWVITKENGNLIFCSYSSNNYIYCNSNDDGVRIGSTDNATTNQTFIIEGNYLKNVKTSRYVGVSVNTNPYSWRCYTVTTGVIKDQTLKFYKKVCLDPTQYWVTWDANGGQWSDGSTKKEEIYTVGATITKPENPSREGYRFDGWTPTPGTMLAVNTTFTAQWKEVYKITWYENGVPSYTEVPSDNPVVTWEDNIANCGEKKFYGWTADETFVSDPTTPPTLISKGTTIAGDVTYYAVYADAEVPANPGYVKVTTISEGTYLIAAPSKNIAYKAVTSDVPANNISNNVISSLPEGATELLVELGTNTNAGYFAISYNNNGTKTYIYGAEKSLNTTNTATYDWSLDADNATLGEIQSKSKSGFYIQANNTNGDFKAYAHTQTVAYLYKKQTTTYENFAVSCATYDISVTPPTGGTVTTTPADEAGAGQEITINVTPDDCKYLTGLKYNYDSDHSDYSIDIYSTPYTFTMLAANVTVTATFADKTATDIEILTSAHRMLMQGSSFVGEQVRITYNNGDTETLNWNDSRLTFSGYNMATLGTYTVRVDYNDCGTANTSYSIEVIDGIAITFIDAGISETIKYELNAHVDVETKTGQYACSGYEFVGWSETEFPLSDVPNMRTSEEYVPVRNFNATTSRTLYAVYSILKKQGWVSIEDANHIRSGAEYMIVKNRYDTYSALSTTTSTYNANYRAATILDKDEDDNTGNMIVWRRTSDNTNFQIYTGTATNDVKWLLIKKDNKNYLYNQTEKKYLQVTTTAITLTSEMADNFKITDEGGDCCLNIQSATSNYYISGYNSSNNYYFQPYSTETDANYLLTRDSLFTTTPPCYPLYATFYGNGGIVTDGIKSGDYLTIKEPTRDAGITTPTASFADCNGKSWTFVGWSRKEIDVTRVPILTTDLLHDGGGNQHYYIQENGEEFWAIFTNTGEPETKYGTITFTKENFPNTYDNISKSCTIVENGDSYNFCYTNVAKPSSNSIQIKEGEGYLTNTTSLGKINSISFTNFIYGNINCLKVSLGTSADALTTVLTAEELQVVDGVYTYYPKANYSFFKIESIEDAGAVGIETISIDFGKGTQIWATTPNCSDIFLSGNELYVTSTQGRAVMAPATLTVKANQLEANADVILTSNSSDVYFSTDRTFNFAAGQAEDQKLTTSLTLPTDAEGNLATTDVYIHYMPSSEGNGVPADVVISANLETPNPSISDDHTIHVRNLPAKFVIATKVGETWYALPANMTGETNPLAEVIEVDETTMTATAPNTSTYTLWPVKTTNGTGNRYTDYGDRLRFAAVNYEQRGLWANNNNNSSAIRNYAVINSLSADVTVAYEWKITTTVVDGHWQYTLQTDQDKNQNFLRYWTSAEGTPVGPKWGTYNAGENKLYFLPVTEAQPFDYDVVEWYPTKVLIQTDAAITSPTVKVNGVAVASPTLTNKGGKLYEISNLPLEANPNKLLQISFTDNAINYINTKVVPIILSRGAKTITGEPFATLTQKVYQYADVVVRDGATLSINGDTDVANTLFGVTIYPTAKVSVDNGKKLSVHNLTFFGGIDEIYNGSSYEINKYGVPQLSLKGILNKTVTTIDYIMRVDLEQMYQVGVPYDVNLSDITYWDGTAMTLGDNLYVSAYDGQKRADLEPAWVWEIYWKEKVMKAGIGYTISADMQSGVGNEYSIIRLPMKSNIASGNTEAVEDKTVQVYAYDNKNGVEITDNSKGWNFLSNPYMTAISGAEADSKLVVGHLDRDDVSEPWEWVDDTYRYVTIPSDDGTYHYQQKFRDATLLPFKSFFLQIATSGELSFALESRQSAPARYLQTNNKKREVEFEVLLANDTRSDNLGLLIGEAYTPAYEINADLEKMIGSMSVYTIYNGYNLAYNALSPTNAEEQIPIGYVVPTVGEYTWALDESSNVEDIEHIYLYDYETSVITDLLTDVYTFTASEQKSDTRFAINVTLKSKDSTVTGLVNVNKDSEQSVKFIYNDKIYILHNGVIYDATGKFVETINK